MVRMPAKKRSTRVRADKTGRDKFMPVTEYGWKERRNAQARDRRKAKTKRYMVMDNAGAWGANEANARKAHDSGLAVRFFGKGPSLQRNADYLNSEIRAGRRHTALKKFKEHGVGPRHLGW